MPPTALALRDGWALASSDHGRRRLCAGAPAAAVRVDVGEPLPPGTDAVAPLDAVTVRNGTVEAMVPVAPGEGVLPQVAISPPASSCKRAAASAIDLALLPAAGIAGLRSACRACVSRAPAPAAPVLDAAVECIAGAIRCEGGIA